MKALGNKLIDVCPDCGKIIQLNKFLFGQMKWIEEIRVAQPGEVGLCTDDDFTAITDSQGYVWCTETLPKTNERIKRRIHLTEQELEAAAHINDALRTIMAADGAALAKAWKIHRCQ